MAKRKKNTMGPREALINSFRMKPREISELASPPTPEVKHPEDFDLPSADLLNPKPSHRYDYSYILNAAKTSPPERIIARATSFSGWIFRLTHPRSIQDVELANEDHDNERILEDEEKVKKKLGRFVEKRIEDFRLWYNKEHRNVMERNYWILEYADPIDDESNDSRIFLASRLRVNGEPLRCRPDVVLRNKSTKDVIIIERKVTFTNPGLIPKQGWPNLMVQLWCYSWIDNWADAPNVLLIGQIWKAEWRWFTRNNKKERELLINCSPLSLYPRFKRDYDDFHKKHCDLFELYGGKFI